MKKTALRGKQVSGQMRHPWSHAVCQGCLVEEAWACIWGQASERNDYQLRRGSAWTRLP